MTERFDDYTDVNTGITYKRRSAGSGPTGTKFTPGPGVYNTIDGLTMDNIDQAQKLKAMQREWKDAETWKSAVGPVRLELYKKYGKRLPQGASFSSDAEKRWVEDSIRDEELSNELMQRKKQSDIDDQFRIYEDMKRYNRNLYPNRRSRALGEKLT